MGGFLSGVRIITFTTGVAGPVAGRVLAEAGAEPGATVLIGTHDDSIVFDWEPEVAAGEGARGPRGTDRRLDGYR